MKTAVLLGWCIASTVYAMDAFISDEAQDELAFKHAEFNVQLLSMAANLPVSIFF